jgi:hypothetical protein
MGNEVENVKGSESLKSPHTGTPILRRDGTTSAERYLKRLCDHSFLSLWSYAGVYRDQFDSPTAKMGKEVCDLLVVFQNHIIIFSDKDCVYPDGENEELNWRRWYQRAIQESAKQIWGAERWIKSNPQRLFIDSGCTQRFPYPLPVPSTAIFHRIIVAHGASEKCQAALGGSGSLMMDSTLVGLPQATNATARCRPFTIGQVDPDKGYVHVFDDTTLEIVMRTLDTITDFVQYLTKKERFMTGGTAVFATGEEELLAYYLKDINVDGEHDFIIPPDINGLLIEEGIWEEYIHSPEYRAQQRANKVSYLWDRLIEQFNTHILGGTQYYTSPPGIEFSEQNIRFLAREPRTRRRFLAQSLLDLIEKTPSSMKQVRVIEPSRPGDPYFVFLILPHPDEMPYEAYRERRRDLLEAYIMSTKSLYPQSLDIVGIATENDPEAEHRSEDALYLDARDWTEEQLANARSFQQETGLLTKLTKFAGVEREYPVEPKRSQQAPGTRSATRMKGRDRNKPCFCGSGKKLKKCCGQ